MIITKRQNSVASVCRVGQKFSPRKATQIIIYRSCVQSDTLFAIRY